MTRAIIAGRLLDGSGAAEQKRTALLVEKGVIVDVIKAEDLQAARYDEVIDLSHCTLMPPLMDCSVDVARSSSTTNVQKQEESEERIKKEVSRHLHFCHSHGVLGLADAEIDGSAWSAIGLRKGEDIAITVKTAGQIYNTLEHDSLQKSSESPDFIRIDHFPVHHAKNDAAQKKHNLFQLISAGAELGLKTVVRTHGDKGVQEALQAGCHAILQGVGMKAESLEGMARRKVLFIPELVRLKTELELASNNQREELELRLKQHHELLRQARKNGVSVAVGTGAGNSGIIHGETVAEEINLFLKSGYPLPEALRAASLTGAEFFNIPAIALLKPGSKANFIVSRGMVQQLPRKLSYLENVFWQGLPSAGYRKNPVKVAAKY